MDLEDSVVFYKALRNIFVDGGGNSVQLELRHGIDDEEAEQLVLEAADKGYLDVVKGSNPREYTLNIDRLVDDWYDLWEQETSKVSATPENFESFLRSYICSYLENEKHSSIREMLVDEFLIGLNSQTSKSYLSEDFRQLMERIGQDYEGKRSSVEHIKNGLDHR